MNISQITFSFLNPATRVMGLFISNKILAIELGFSDYGEFMYKQANFLLLAGIPVIGMLPLVVRYTRIYKNYIIFSRQLNTIFFLILILSSITILAILALDGKLNLVSSLNIFVYGCLILNPIANQVFFAIRKNFYVLIANIISLIFVVILYFLNEVNLENMNWLLLFLNGHFLIVLVFSSKVMNLRFAKGFQSPLFILPYVASGIVSFISIGIFQYILRDEILSYGSAESVANWMSVVKLNELFILVPLYYFSAYGFKQYLHIKPIEYKNVLRKITICAVFYGLGVYTIFELFGERLVSVMFSEEFIGVSDLFIVSLIGNAAKIILMGVGFYLLAQKKMLIFNILEFLPPLLVIVLFQITDKSPKTAVQVYSLCYTFSIITVLMLSRRYLNDNTRIANI